MDMNFATLEKQNQILQQKLEVRDEEIELLREKIRLLTIKLFGPKTEKLAVLLGQRNLFELDPVDQPQPDDHPDGESGDGEDKALKKPVKRPKRLPKDLPRRTVDHDLSEEEKECGCGQMKCKFGEDRTEELVYKPAILEVLVHIWHLYNCPFCKGDDDFKGEPDIACAPRQPRMIPGSMAGESLLAHVMTAKYADGLPFYRITNQMERLGFALSRATMCNWSRKIGEKLIPLWGLLLEEIKKHSWLQMDETIIQVMNEKGRSNQSTSYMWVMRGGPPGKPIVLFRYDPSRGGKVAAQLLGGYDGIVQTDGYMGYHFIDSPLSPMTHAADWNHARRKFANLFKVMAKGKRSKKSYTYRALAMIKKLYKIERQIKKNDLGLQDVCRVRREQAEPVINQLFDFLHDLRDKTPPKGLLGAAVQYVLDRKKGLRVYLSHGEMTIDTNLVENALRPFVIGRKAWLFSGHPSGAQASAVIYSMVETAKANGWKADAYLLHVFQNLPKAQTEQELRALLPTVPPPMNSELDSE